MNIQPKQSKLNTCADGNCPDGVDSLKKIGLTPKEKRAIFFSLKEEIFQQKQLRRKLSLF